MLGFEGENAREKVIVLFTMCFALAMAMLDNTVVNVALPTISRDLNAGVSELQWIVDGYVLAFASLLLTGGILGDRYGRKKMFLGGLAIFTFASIACGLSSTTTQLILARGIQGIGAALLMPGTLSIITVTFPPQERARAIGLWAGMSALALALGPTVGGLMVEHLGWESVFFLNAPIGLIAFLVATRTVSESVSAEQRSLDVPGLVLGTSTLFLVTYGLIEGNEKGWTDPTILGSLVGAGVLLVAFLIWETRNPKAMMPMRFFRIPAFSAGNAVAFSVSLGMFATFFFLSLYMQTIRGYSAFEAGVRFLPMTLLIIVTAPRGGQVRATSRLADPDDVRPDPCGIGAARPLPAGPRHLVPPDAAGLRRMGHGMGATMAPMTAAVMNAVGHERAGLGSAMTNTSREVGGVFGIALLGTILTTRLKSAIEPALTGIGLTPQQQAAVAETAGHGALDPRTLTQLPAGQRAAVLQAFRESFMSGFRVSLLVAGVVLLVAALVANRFIPGRTAHREEMGRHTSREGMVEPALEF